MISLSGATAVIVYLLVAAAVFGLLFWLVEYVGKQFPEGGGLFVKVARVVLVVLAVLVLIGLLLSFVGAIPGPLFRP